jgi:flagellar biosynthesis protein FlhG
MEELDHYDTLEVSRDATPDEIERAYRLLLSTFGGDSLATYSLFGAEESAAMRDRIETAYRVLSDADLRRSYDAVQAGEEPAADESAHEEPVVLAPLAEAALAKPLVETRAREGPAFDRIADAEESGGDADWNGARLRRARLARGFEIDDVAAVTKISPAYLRFLEEDRYDDLPAVVYVRGFVASYARYLGLDAQAVSRTYTGRLEDYRRAKPKGRLLGRR